MTPGIVEPVAWALFSYLSDEKEADVDAFIDEALSRGEPPALGRLDLVLRELGRTTGERAERGRERTRRERVTPTLDEGLRAAVMHELESGLVPARGGRLLGLARLADKLGGGETAAWGGEIGAAEALRKLNSRCDRIVSYVGKLIVSRRAVDLLLGRLAASSWRACRRRGWSSSGSGRTGRRLAGSWTRLVAGTWRRCMRSRLGGASSREALRGD